MFSLTLLLALSAASLAAAAPHPAHDRDRDHDHDHTAPRALSSQWFHPDNHPAHALFRRQTNSTAPTPTQFPAVGSPAWAAAYPQGTPDSNAMPQAWKDALAAAVQAGKIPTIAPSHQSSPSADPTYGSLNPNGPQVCSATYQCVIPGDTEVWNAPPGVIGISFDDGPLPTSDKLYAFLAANHVRATHFYIGENILENWKEFNAAFANGDDIAVHTWTHPYMTTLSNADVVAQLGWTLQLIYNSTGGHLAKFWRPPYGDADTRVVAIAKEVFGLTTVIWNQDTNDWSLGEAGGTNPTAIATNFKKWLTGSKSPGLIVLEHELSTGSVQAFIDAFPLMQQNNWTLRSVAALDGASASYQNAQDSPSQPNLLPLTAGGLDASLALTSSAPAATSASASASLGANAASAGVPAASASGINNQAGGKKNAARAPRAPAAALALSAAGVLIGLFCAA
ncbi:carbohydrate esterase family 4 protein [Auriscalpium vulgare]|uniref:Carbohydrate esterase family 4 protein n=1 Tax=Auriscalpium vulgare TaxID=40419 RepID=A0ACB8SCN5_9AGAM|nr:carbohydrate esterase family 4 protein [Auriscalpium vulgare]